MDREESIIGWREALMPKYKSLILGLPLLTIFAIREYAGASQDFLVGNSLGASAISCVLAWVPAYIYWLIKRRRLPFLDYVILSIMILVLAAFGSTIIDNPSL